MNIHKSYPLALKYAFQAGAECVANPGHEDCGSRAGREDFAFYCDIDNFDDLPKEKQQEFWVEWRKGMAAERKLVR